MKTLSLIALLLTVGISQAMGLRAMIVDPHLDLSTDQQASIVDLLDQQHLSMVDLRATAKTADLELQIAIRKGTESIGKLENRIDDVSAANSEIEKKRLRTRLAVREILTDEQRTTFDIQYAPRSGKGPHGPPKFADISRARHSGKHHKGNRR